MQTRERNPEQQEESRVLDALVGSVCRLSPAAVGPCGLWTSSDDRESAEAKITPVLERPRA